MVTLSSQRRSTEALPSEWEVKFVESEILESSHASSLIVLVLPRIGWLSTPVELNRKTPVTPTVGFWESDPSAGAV